MPARLRFGDLSIEGESRGGESSWFRLHPPGLAFDVGRGAPELVGAGDFFITHGHLDHALGLPFVLSRRTAQGLAAARVFCPRAALPLFADFLAVSARLEDREYAFDLQGLDPGEEVKVGSDLTVAAFAVDHGVPALGYHLRRRRRRLRAELLGRAPAEIVERRRRGETVEEEWVETWVSYCGDTAAAVFDLEPELARARILLIECTFLRPEHRERAARFGHLHLADLEERADGLECEAIVLVHLSRRHSTREARDRLASSPSAALRQRGLVFPDADPVPAAVSS